MNSPSLTNQSVINVNWRTNLFANLNQSASVTLPNVTAYTTTRIGGVSEAPYQSFNLGTHVGDSITSVHTNHQLLQQYCQFNPIQWLNQIHSSEVITFSQYCNTPYTGDAIYCNTKNQPIAVLTADCLPILLANEQGDEIAAIHGGWRPLVSNVIANTLAKFICQPEKIYAWLGPCIGPDAFVVGAEVKQRFCDLKPEFANAFTAQQDGKYLADLHTIAKMQLQNLGVVNVSALTDCTYLNPQKYFSFRKQNQTGRMASVICLT